MKSALKIVYFSILFGVGAFSTASCASGTIGGGKAALDKPVDILAYIDPLCAHSQKQLASLKTLKDQYGDKLKIQYRLFPLEPLFPQSPVAVQAAECARDQKKFDEMVEKIAANAKNFDAGAAKKLAGGLNLDQAAFDGCLDQGRKKAEVDKAISSALNSKVDRTPTLLIYGKKIEGAQEASVLSNLIAFETASAANKKNSSYSDKVKSKMRVEVVEFGDFQCPFCSRALPQLQQLLKNYGAQINFSYKHFPLSFHNQAFKAAEASECARDQGMFDKYHDKLFENMRALDVPNLKQYAVQLGLDAGKFNQCLDSGAKKEAVDADFAAGQKAGVSGTPSFLIGGELVVGAVPYETLEQAMKLKLEGKPLGNLASGGQKEPEADTSADPAFNITALNDAKCPLCSTAQMTGVLKTKFPKATVKELDYNTPEGKALKENNNIAALPAYLFDEAVKDAANFAALGRAMTKTAGGYLLSPRESRAVKFFDAPKITGGHEMGPKNAKVTIVEYSDFQCPFCNRAEPTLKQVMAKYSDKVKLVYRHFPLSFHQDAQKASEASECAADQGKFWEYHAKIFENQKALDANSLKQYASALGLNAGAFNKCLDGGEKAQMVKDQLAEGAKFGVQGTPGFFVNEYFVSGAQPPSEFEKVIDSILK